MRVKGSAGDGFLLCFLVNLLFNFWWGIIAVVLFILSIWLGISIFWSLIGLFIWFGVAFLSTALVIWAVSTGDEKTPHRENLNPYSAKNSDLFPPKDDEVESVVDNELESVVDSVPESNPDSGEEDVIDSTGDVEKNNSGESAD